MRAFRPYVAVAIALAVAGCSSGSIPTAPPVRASAVSVKFSIILPRAATSNKRTPAYISASTASAVIAVSQGGGAAQSTTITCSGGQCQGTVQAPIGSDVFKVSLLDASQNVLSTGTTTATILDDQANTVNVTFNPVLSSVVVTAAQTSFTIGSSATTTLTVQGEDSDGNSIVGPGCYVDSSGNPVTITLSTRDVVPTGDTGSTTIASSQISCPSVSTATLSYNGGGISRTSLSAAAGPAAVTVTTPSLTYSLPATGAHLYVAENGENVIQEYPLSAGGSGLHLKRPAFGLSGPTPIASIYNGVNNPVAMLFGPTGDLYVFNNPSGNVCYVAVYAIGTTSPKSSFNCPASAGNGISAVAADAANGYYISIPTAGSYFYSWGATSPSRTYSGVTAAQIAVDAGGNVAFAGASGVTVFPRGSTTASLTLAFGSAGVAFDGSGNMWVANNSNAGPNSGDQVSVYAPGSTTASQTFSIGNSKIYSDFQGDMYTLDSIAGEATEYPAGSNASSRTLNTADTSTPQLLAFDGSGNVYMIVGNGPIPVYGSSGGLSTNSISTGITSPVAVIVGP